MKTRCKEEEKENYLKQIKAKIESLGKKSGGLDDSAFWKIKTVMTMLDKKGKKVEGIEAIAKIVVYFTSVQSIVKRWKQQQQQLEAVNEKKVKLILENAKTWESIKIKEQEVEKEISKIKSKKAGDSEGWWNEMILSIKELRWRSHEQVWCPTAIYTTANDV